MISPLCLDGAVGDDEKRDALAALMAKFLRHESSVDVSSWIFASVTFPELSTTMRTVTIPPP